MDSLSTQGSIMLHGKGVSKGYAIGRAVVMGAAALEVQHYRIAKEEVLSECERLDFAIKTVQDELGKIMRNLPADAPKEIEPILNVHLLLVSDPDLSEQTKRLIHEKQYNAEWALTTQGQILAEQFSHIDDDYIRERSADVRQVIERIISVLIGEQNIPTEISNASQTPDDESLPLIVVAHDISPADMIKLRGSQFAAFLTDLGGITSHTAIVARSLNVPAIVAMGNVRAVVRNGDTLIVDGQTGTVIINPSETILAEYQAIRDKFLHQRQELLKQKNAAAITQDGIDIKLLANIELPSEVDQAINMGAEGIGLFRSEFLFIGRPDLPSEEEQYQAYKHVLQAMEGKEVTIRTLDVGSDKALDGEVTVAVNPALGLRAIRYCLAQPEMFNTQLRALLRASVHGNLNILLPMVAHYHEVTAAHKALNQARIQLRSENIPFKEHIPLGVMVEIPAMAIALEAFAPYFDFFSIGTNDLIQYTLAIDRVDNEVAHLYDATHPAVLSLIEHVLKVGRKTNKKVSVCGEMAGDAEFTRLLLGFGLRNFSMQAHNLLDIKEIVRNSDVAKISQLIKNPIESPQSLNMSYLN